MSPLDNLSLRWGNHHLRGITSSAQKNDWLSLASTYHEGRDGRGASPHWIHVNAPDGMFHYWLMLRKDVCMDWIPLNRGRE